jgi:hypothetical protein
MTMPIEIEDEGLKELLRLKDDLVTATTILSHPAPMCESCKKKTGYIMYRGKLLCVDCYESAKGKPDEKTQ